MVVNNHSTYEVISKFVWSASILGLANILGKKTMYWCIRRLYVDNLDYLGLLFQLTKTLTKILAEEKYASPEKSYSTKYTYTMVRQTP